jgi:hypothetical protein
MHSYPMSLTNIRYMTLDKNKDKRMVVVEIPGDSVESESSDGRPRYWRTPSVVVSDYSDYSYFDEKFERSDSELEKLDGNSASPSQASSCSCLDCDEVRDFQDLSPNLENHMLQLCRHRRHSDSCCVCVGPINLGISRYMSEKLLLFTKR